MHHQPRQAMDQVEYRALSQFQNRECLWCDHDATQQAVFSRGNMTAVVLCCDDPKCMNRARDMCENTVGAA
jgi:hypothetical protein